MKTNQEKSKRLGTALTNVADLIGPVGTDANGKPVGLNMYKEEKECREKAAQIQKGIFITQVMGGYNSGKSATINALVMKEMLPALIRPTTAILTILQYGEKDECKVYFKDTQDEAGNLVKGEVVGMSIEEFKSTYSYTAEDDKEYLESGYVKRFSIVDHAVVKVNCNLLGNSNQLLDSPGLRNNVVDNALAIEMAQKANAIIYVGTADKAGFDMDDKEYFTENFGVCPNHVFFLVNKFDTCRTEEDKQHVRSKVEVDLAPYFTDEDGVIKKDLMGKRIFFTSALNAISSFKAQRINEYGELEHLSEEQCQKMYENSGFGPFVAELENFLSSDSKNLVVYSNGINHLKEVQKKAVDRVKEDDVVYKTWTRASDLEKWNTQDQIEKIELKIASTESSINTWSLRLQNQCSEIVRSSVQHIEDTWEQDVLGIAEKTQFSFGKYLKLSAKQLNIFKSKEKRSKEVEDMLEPFAVAVTDHIGDVIAQNVKDNMPAVEKTVSDAESEIGTSFNGVTEMFKALPGNCVKSKAKMGAPEVSFAQQLISLYFGDLSEMTSGAGNGRKPWMEFIKRTIINTFWQWAIVVILTGPFAPLVILAIEAWQMKKAKDNHAITALNKAKSSIMTGLKGNLDKIIEEKNLMLAKYMDKIKDDLCAESRIKLDEAKARLKKLMDDLANNHHNYEAEMKRCKSILERIDAEIQDAGNYILEPALNEC